MYDLGDASKWEFMFSTTDKPLLMIPTVDDPLEIDDDEVLSLPVTLSRSFSLNTRDFKQPLYRLLQQQLINNIIASAREPCVLYVMYISQLFSS